MPKVDAAKVTKLRLEKSMSQAVLARRAGVDRRTVWRLEAGHGVSEMSLALIANALSIPVSELFDSEPSTNSTAPTSPPTLPKQARSAHFSIKGGRIATIPTQDFWLDENNYRRIESLQGPLLDAVQRAISDLDRGNKPFSILVEVLKKYCAQLNQDARSINYAVLYAYGLQFAATLDNAKAAARLGDLPDLSLEARSVLETVVGLHGPFILSSKDGQDLVADAERYSRSPNEEAAFRMNLQLLGDKLIERGDLIAESDVEFVRDITREENIGSQRERQDLFSRGAAKNLVIVVSAGALIASTASIPMVGPFVAASLGLVTVEALKKSKTFGDLAGSIQERIDDIRSIDLNRLREIASSGSEKFREFVISNQQLLLRVGGGANEMRWLHQLLRWIGEKSDNSDKSDYWTDDDIEGDNQPLSTFKMSKKMLYSLPENIYVVSNAYEQTGAPILSGWLTNNTDKDVFWEMVRERKLNGLLFHMFRSEKSYRHWRLP